MRYCVALLLAVLTLPVLAFDKPDDNHEKRLSEKPDSQYENLVVRGYYSDRDMVGELARDYPHMIVDHYKRFVIVEVNRAGYQSMIQSGWQVELEPELTEKLNTVYGRLPGQSRGIDGFACYRTVAETYTDAAQIAIDNPDLAEWIDIGDSWEKANVLGGSDMRVLKLTNVATSGPVAKPKIFIMSAVHAREYSTAELNTRFAEYLVDNYGINADATWLLDHHEIHLSLQSNPDGRAKAQTGLSWRKNTNTNYCGPESNSRGADLNRNFEFLWGCCGGSSGNQCSATYRGPFAASEPETQAIQDYVRGILPDQRAPELDAPAPADATGVFLDIHSYGELILWPWGFGPELAPNGTALQTLGRRLAWFNDYYPEQAIGLYPTDGTTDDFAYGELGLAAYTFELGTTFFQDCGTFENQILPDNLQALVYAAKVARTPYITPAGPETLSLGVAAGAVPPGEFLVVSGIADDGRSNNVNGSEPAQPIAGAEAYINTPPWGPTPTAIALAAADGSFNETAETLQGSIDTTGLGSGQHMLFVRAQDQAGNWGPLSAEFFYVVDPETAPVINGTVTAADTGLPLSGTVDASGPFSSATDATGFYELLLVPGTYDLTFIPDSADYALTTVAGLSVADGDVLTQDLTAFPYCDLLADDVESGNIGWSAESPWAITNELANTGSASWTDSPGSNYSNNLNISLTSPIIDISNTANLRLEFASLCQTEANYDYCIVEVSAGANNWFEVARYDGIAGNWQDISIDLAQLESAATTQVRFRLDTDVTITEDGWHIDDIRLRGAGPQCLTGDADGDGIIDGFDNCTLVANSDQRDTNGDGIGNICDPDLNNDNVVNFADLQILKTALFSNGDLDSDLDGDNATNFADLLIMKSFFFGQPGPAAL